MANLQLVGNIAGSEAAIIRLTLTYLSDYRDEQGRVPPPVLLFEKLAGQEWTAQPNGGAAIVLGPAQMGIAAPRVSVTYSLIREGLPPLARTLERYVVPNTDPDGFWDFTRADGNGIYNGSPEDLTQVNVLPGQGPQGEAGHGVLTGTGAPAANLGRNGDSYLNTVTWDVYLRGGGTWALTGNIKGGTGGVGPQGLPGVNGTNFPIPTSAQEGYLPVADGSQPSGFSWFPQSTLRLRKLGDVNATGITNGQTLIWDAASSRFLPSNMDGGGGSMGLDTEAVQDAIAAMLVAGNGITLNYNDAGDVLTIGSTSSGSSNSSLSISAGTVVMEVPKFSGTVSLLNVSSSITVGDSFTFTLESGMNYNLPEAYLRIRKISFDGEYLDPNNPLSIRFTMKDQYETVLDTQTISASSVSDLVYQPPNMDSTYCSRLIITAELLSGAGNLYVGSYGTISGYKFIYLGDNGAFASNTFTGVRILKPTDSQDYIPACQIELTRTAGILSLYSRDSENTPFSSSGTTMYRPYDARVGDQYYDITLSKPLWFNDGWRDVSGTLV